LLEIFFVPTKNELHKVKNVCFASCQASVVLVRVEWNVDFLNIVSKNILIPNSMIIPLVGAEVLHVDGWTDEETNMTNLTVKLYYRTLKTQILIHNLAKFSKQSTNLKDLRSFKLLK
jgi:hypothetical protein